tara:strand:+ start:371122 stop:371730 length:609 start_codon:yes stop_codon:yes gene_type:complete
MARRFDQNKLVIASHNAGKVREIGALLEPFNVEVVSAGTLGLDEPEETGETFVDNALLKAHAAAKASGLPALADDSGLSVWALSGAPGIYSARWAGPDKDFNVAMNKVEELMRGAEDRTAAFICALALAWPDGHADVFEGSVSGEITWPPRGDKGFGYDPIFVAEGETQTFAEIEPARKHVMSHRADAFNQLVAACFAEQGT